MKVHSYFVIATMDGQNLDWWGAFETLEQAENFKERTCPTRGLIVTFVKPPPAEWTPAR